MKYKNIKKFNIDIHLDKSIAGYDVIIEDHNKELERIRTYKTKTNALLAIKKFIKENRPLMRNN